LHRKGARSGSGGVAVRKCNIDNKFHPVQRCFFSGTKWH
jgi:hypothetical protein